MLVVVLSAGFHLEAFMLTKLTVPQFLNRKLPMIFVASAHSVLNHYVKKEIGFDKLNVP